VTARTRADLEPNAKKKLKREKQVLHQIYYPPDFGPIKGKPYDILYIDPPWEYETWSEEGQGRSASQHYRVMTLSDIKALKIRDLAAPSSVLLLWATAPNLEQAFELMKAWGYTFKTVAFTWIKRNKGDKGNPRLDVGEMLLFLEITRNRKVWAAWKAVTPEEDQWDLIKKARNTLKWLDSWFFGNGHYTRANAEFCLLATRGKVLPRASASVPATIVTPIGEHSAKPLEVRDRIEELFGDRRRIELFARSRKIGWDALGYEYDGQDVRVSMSKLFKRPPRSENIPLPFEDGPPPPCFLCGWPLSYGQITCSSCTYDQPSRPEFCFGGRTNKPKKKGAKR
jgi:N6-adenosine-specific RNA methylase IME4